MSRPVHRGRVGLVLLSAAFATALGGAALAKPGPRTVRITIAEMKFSPPSQGLRVRDAIEWVNADIFRHTATARNGAFDVDLQPKARARMVLRKAGQVSFYCRYHPGMTGTLSVGAAAR